MWREAGVHSHNREREASGVGAACCQLNGSVLGCLGQGPLALCAAFPLSDFPGGTDLHLGWDLLQDRL